MKTFKQLIESINIGIGTTWNSVDGVKEIINKNNTHYQVKSQNNKLPQLIRINEIEREIDIDERRYKSRKAKQGNKQDDVENSVDPMLQRYLDGLSKAQAGVALKSLTTKGIRNNGKFYKNTMELVKHLVSSGYKVVGDNLESSKTGSFIEGRKLGKHGIGFAKSISK